VLAIEAISFALTHDGVALVDGETLISRFLGQAPEVEKSGEGTCNVKVNLSNTNPDGDCQISFISSSWQLNKAQTRKKSEQPTDCLGLTP